MHISKEIIGTKGSQLAGCKLVLCLCGSVAVLKFTEIARSLMRLGAEVYPVMSQAATELITPDFVHWATGNKPVIRLSGEVEHVRLAGNVPGKADLILVAPATANTIGKIACGIDDTPVTTVVTTALGEGIPLIIVPAMHQPMYNHPVVKENIRKLKELGLTFIDPRIEEGKAKIAAEAEIIAAVTHILRPRGSLAGKKVLITAGPTIEYLDPVRILTNRSSGKMGMALAACALQEGAAVTIVYGPGTALPPPQARVVKVETGDQMHQAVLQELQTTMYDLVIAAAAVSDWKPLEPQARKVPTRGVKRIQLELQPTVKIIDHIKQASPASTLVCFKALTFQSDAELIEIATRRMEQAQADFVVVNDVSRQGAGFGVDTNEVFVIARDKSRIHIPQVSKIEVARGILQFVSRSL